MNNKVTGELTMYKIFGSLSLIIFLTFSPFSNATDALFKSKTQNAGTQKIINSGELRLAINNRENPPFYYSDPKGVDGTSGLGVELGKKIAKELGIKLRIIRKTSVFNELVQSVAKGEADVAMSKLSISLPRAAYIEYSKPYINFRQAILVNRLRFAEKKIKPNDSIYDFFNRKEVSLGVISNSSYETFAKQLFPNGSIRGYKSWDDAFNALDKGEVSGIFRDEFEVSRTLRGIPNGSIKFMSVVIKGQKDPIAMVLPWDKLHFKHWINHFIDSKEISYNSNDVLEMLETYNKNNKA